MKTNTLFLAIIMLCCFAANAQQNLRVNTNAFTSGPVSISLAAYDGSGNIVGYSDPFTISSGSGVFVISTSGTPTPGFTWSMDPSACGCSWTIGVVSVWNTICSTYGMGTPAGGCAQYDILAIGDPNYGWLNSDCFEYSGVCGGPSVGASVTATFNPNATPDPRLVLKTN